MEDLVWPCAASGRRLHWHQRVQFNRCQLRHRQRITPGTRSPAFLASLKVGPLGRFTFFLFLLYHRTARLQCLCSELGFPFWDWRRAASSTARRQVPPVAKPFLAMIHLSLFEEISPCQPMSATVRTKMLFAWLSPPPVPSVTAPARG